MRHSFFTLSLIGIALLISSCDRSGDPIPVPGDPPDEVPVPSAEEASTISVETETPALTEAAIESLILDALSPAREDPTVAAADPETFSIHNLPEAQQKTLNDALQKAVSKIDFKALLSSIASNLDIKGLDLANLPANANVTTRVLTPDEAAKMGIDFKGLTGKGGDGDRDGDNPGTGNFTVGNVQVITIGDGQNSPLSIPPLESTEKGNDTLPKSAQMSVTEVTPIEVTEESDPERTARFQSLLESGDSDALASEIADVIQTGIDTATLQQAMGGGVEVPSAPGE